MKTARDLYVHLLQTHDWAFEYSDDHTVWTRGRHEAALIGDLQKRIDPDYAIWRSVAPASCPVREAA